MKFRLRKYQESGPGTGAEVSEKLKAVLSDGLPYARALIAHSARGVLNLLSLTVVQKLPQYRVKNTAIAVVINFYRGIDSAGGDK